MTAFNVSPQHNSILQLSPTVDLQSHPKGNFMASQSALCDVFLRRHSNIGYGKADWQQYENGIWSRINELAVKHYVQTICRDSRTKLSSSVVSSVTELIKANVHINSQLFDSNPNIITFNDCCLDLLTYSIVPHSQAYYATSKLSFDYDPAAQCAAWDAALRSFPFSDFLQEFSGLTLTTEMKYEVAVWLYGPAGGGKSTFITGLEAALGSRVCVLGLNEIDKSAFALAQIPGKTLAVSTEQPAYFIKCSHILNSLISGESTSINQKFKPAFTINPKAKLLWAMNELPSIPSGAGAGLFRRVYPVYWPALSESDRDPNIKEEIARNGMAVVNWMLMGLRRLRDRGRFEFPGKLLEARNTYRTNSDTTLCFVEECFDLIEDAETKSSEIYDIYKEWSIANGHRGTLASNRFAVEMQRLGFEKTRRSTGVFWLGVAPKIDVMDWEVADDARYDIKKV